MRFCALAWRLALVGIVVLGGGCSGSIKYNPVTHPGLAGPVADRLAVGMSSEEVEALLGPPNETYEAEFGADVGEEWTGVVWLYFIERDEKLRKAVRYRKARLVFYETEEGLRLNHWDIEGP
jgi:hypothetical protein